MVPSQDLEYEPGLGAVNLEVAVPAVSDSKSEKRKTYQKWSSQERFTIGKYAAINDPTAVKKIGSKSRPWFCAMYKAELEKARKEKRPIAPNLNVLREIIWSKSFYWLSEVEVF